MPRNPNANAWAHEPFALSIATPVADSIPFLVQYTVLVGNLTVGNSM